MVGMESGQVEMYNIEKGFKQFTTMMAYADGSVNQIVPLINVFGITSGAMTVGIDGCVSIWTWKKPQFPGSRGGRGGRGRGRGRGFKDRDDGQGGQGRGF